MLTKTELGKAIEIAIELKKRSGAISSKKDVADHFGIKPPSIHDWIKKGSISKDKLPELWRYFSDVVGPEHWGLTNWPEGDLFDFSEKKSKNNAIENDASKIYEAYINASEEERELVRTILFSKSGYSPSWINSNMLNARSIMGLLHEIRMHMDEPRQSKRTA